MKRLNTAFLVAAIVAGGAFGESAAFAQTATSAAGAAAPSTAKTATATTTASTAPASAAQAAPAPASTTAPAPASTTPPAPASTTPAPNTGSPASTGTAPSGSASAGANGQVDGATYVVRLRDLETRIDELKEQIRRSHTRLSLLSDTILSGGLGGARAEITFRNDLSNAFRLTGVVFVLDGVVQYNRQDDSEAGLLDSRREIPIFSGSIPPGDHTLQVVLRVRGHGYGVFSYLRGYKFDLKSSHSFTVAEGKTVSLETVAWEKGDVTTPLEQRPAVRHESSVRAGTIESGRPSSTPAPSKAVRGSANVTTGAGSVSGGASVGVGADK